MTVARFAAVALAPFVATYVQAQENVDTCLLREVDFGCVKASPTSWLQFCPDNDREVTTASDDGDARCFRMRPFRYGLHQNGNEVEGTDEVRWDISESLLGSLTQNCSAGVCAYRANSTDPLQVNLLEMNASGLLSIQDSIKMNVMMFKSDGNMTYNATSVDVQKGSYKWGIVINRSSEASSTTASTKLEFELKPADNDTAISSAEVVAENLVVTGGMTSFPRFQAVTADGMEWREVGISVRDFNGVAIITYEFPGPFLEASYDPLVARQTAEDDPAPTPRPREDEPTVEPSAAGSAAVAISSLMLAGAMIYA